MGGNYERKPGKDLQFPKRLKQSYMKNGVITNISTPKLTEVRNHLPQ